MNWKHWMYNSLFLLAVLLAIPAGQVWAQAVFGTIEGSVKDETGGILPGVEVLISDPAKGSSWTVLTDDSGNFRKERLMPGTTYQVQVSMPGFKTFVGENVVVGVDQVTTIDVVLTIGEMTEQITVSAASTPLLKREKTDVSVSFSERQVKELPIFERNFTQFLLLSPGTQRLGWQHASSENPQGSKQIMVNGQHFSGTGFELDGTSNRDPILGIIVINPTLEGVTEAKITSQNYDAEFGQATAGVVTAQTKSGTNEFHGSAFLFRRNDQSQARNPFTQTNPLDPSDPDKFIPDILWNQYGGSIGGPIVKDKAFFFFDFQQTRRKNGGSVLTTVPMASARQIVDTPFGRGIDLTEYVEASGNKIFNPFSGDPNDASTREQFAGNVIPEELVSPQALALISQLPIPNQGGIQNNFTAAGIEAFDDSAFNVRGDWAYSDNLHIFGRYSFADFERSGPGAFGDLLGGPAFDNIFFSGSSNVRNQSVAAGFDYTINPTLLTDFRFGFFRYNVGVLPGGVGTTPAADAGIPNLNSVPGVDQDAIFTSGMPAFFIEDFGGGTGGSEAIRFGFALGINQCNCPLDESEQQWQWVSNWIKAQGDHTFKFGADIRWAQNRRVPSDNHRSGELFFRNVLTQGFDPDEGAVAGGLGLASFLLGEVSNFSRFVSPITDAEERQKRWFFYGQDTWKATDKLTINFGLRWEIYFPEKVKTDEAGGFLDFEDEPGTVRVAGLGDIGRDFNVSNSFQNLAPRLGITYQIDDRSVLRMGYGRSFDLGVFGSTFGHAVTQNLPVLAQQNLNPDRNFQGVFNLAEGPQTPPFPEAGPDGTFPAPDGVQFFIRPNRMRLPTLDAWNVTYQRELPGDLVWEVAYVGNKGTHVFVGNGPDFNPNQPDIIGFTEGLSANERKPFFNGPIRGFGAPLGLSQNFRYFCNCSDNNYNAFQTKLEKRFSAGWSTLIHWTLARARNHEAGFFPFDPDLDHGPTDEERKSTLVINTLYELPIGRGKAVGTDWSGVTDAVLGNWQINFSTNWSSGLPFSPTNSDCDALRDTGPCRPNLVGEAEAGGDRNGWFTTGTVDEGGPFEIPQRGTFGNVRRNTFRGPSFFNTDFAIFKNVPLSETVRVQFRAEIFNVFNKVNLGQPNNCINCSDETDGRIFNLAAGASMRQVQWALRVEF